MLASAPGAALQAGPAWFKALIEQATEPCPDIVVTAILDCGDQPGAAMGALRAGLNHLRFDGPAAVAEKLAEMGAILAAPAEATLDLLDAKDPEAACRAFLELS